MALSDLKKIESLSQVEGIYHPDYDELISLGDHLKDSNDVSFEYKGDNIIRLRGIEDDFRIYMNDLEIAEVYHGFVNVKHEEKCKELLR